MGLSNTAQQVSGPTQPCGHPTVRSTEWTTWSLQQNTWRVLGSWQYFYLILSELLMWNGSTWSRALAWRLQLQCSNTRASAWLTRKPCTSSLCPPVPTCQVWHCSLCFPTLRKVPPAANRTRLLLRWTLKNVSSHIVLNTGKLIKEKNLSRTSENYSVCFLHVWQKPRKETSILLIWLKIIQVFNHGNSLSRNSSRVPFLSSEGTGAILPLQVMTPARDHYCRICGW